MLTSSHFATLPLLISEKPLLFYLPCKNLLKRVYLGQLHRTVGREMLAARPDDLSSIPGIHMVKTSSQRLLSGLHTHTGTHVHHGTPVSSAIYTNIYTSIK